jgi:hypothetical protein
MTGLERPYRFLCEMDGCVYEYTLENAGLRRSEDDEQKLIMAEKRLFHRYELERVNEITNSVSKTQSSVAKSMLEENLSDGALFTPMLPRSGDARYYYYVEVMSAYGFEDKHLYASVAIDFPDDWWSSCDFDGKIENKKEALVKKGLVRQKVKERKKRMKMEAAKGLPGFVDEDELEEEGEGVGEEGEVVEDYYFDPYDAGNEEEVLIQEYEDDKMEEEEEAELLKEKEKRENKGSGGEGEGEGEGEGNEEIVIDELDEEGSDLKRKKKKKER